MKLADFDLLVCLFQVLGPTWDNLGIPKLFSEKTIPFFLQAKYHQDISAILEKFTQ